MLQVSTALAAFHAPRVGPESIARRIGAPSDYEWAALSPWAHGADTPRSDSKSKARVRLGAFPQAFGGVTVVWRGMRIAWRASSV